ncbi:hypothetical protein PHMEG_00011461 [Phytophthora megakarya]|uniref:Reverse transcriptase RNase H-like domain-containing protein n=1 Tax=Phytophthora megakarya TaxID=4795 RepID=A0A225WCK7_9STRA|nr:hypothetical protein PHMEG_00011461 [Phytophthora megakarya]
MSFITTDTVWTPDRGFVGVDAFSVALVSIMTLNGCRNYLYQRQQRACNNFSVLLDGRGIHCRRTKNLAAGVVLDWPAQDEDHFQSTKALLSSSQLLHFPKATATVEPFTDASDLGWGLVVTYVETWHHELLICKNSIFDNTERHWSIIEGKPYPIIWDARQLDYLLARPSEFLMFCDHKNLITVFSPTHEVKRHVRTKLQRWVLSLTELEYCIKHIDGTANVWGDLLLRWGLLSLDEEGVHVKCKLVTRNQRRLGVATDRQLDELRPRQGDFIFSNLDDVKHAQQQHKQTASASTTTDDHGVLVVNGLIWIPDAAKELRQRILIVADSGGQGHRGLDPVLAIIKELFSVGTGVPEPPRNLMIDFLGSGVIDVCTAFGWLSTGEREFGIGQGSILSILHISCYMDCLQARLAECADLIKIQHHQTGGRRVSLGSTLFVDDQLDITSTEQGAQERAEITTMFTGKTGTGGVFGASGGNELFQAVSLNDGMGIPRQVQVVSPSEGFKRLGIYQGGDDLWEAAVSPVWHQVLEEAERIQCQLRTLQQFRYVVNSVWVPRIRYRMILGGAYRSSGLFDTFIRQVSRSVLRLAHPSPTSIYYDQSNGVGLLICEPGVNVHRYQEALRILNTPELPVHHALVESLEAYQV